MTYRQLYLTARRLLDSVGIDAPGADAALLLEHFFGLTRPGIALHGEETPTAEKEAAFLKAAHQRAEHRPLQYILGRWEFMGLSLAVGEGVLVPREDTGILVEAVANAIAARPAAVGVDLCAGTGAVALGIASLVRLQAAACVEISPAAFGYLEKNLAAYPQYPIRAVQGDILRPETAEGFADGSLDFLAANPPYIPTGELSSLQVEVQNEPALALDGGADGLRFYRAIGGLWVRKVKPGGAVAVEIGEEQGQAVAKILQAAGVTDIEIFKDWAGLPRCVAGKAR